MSEEEHRRLVVGGWSRAELREALDARGVLLNVHAETLLGHEAFDARAQEQISVVERSVAELDLTDATLPEIFTAARRHGLALCPPDTGPYLRLALASQQNAPDSVMSTGRSPTAALTVASEPLSDDVEFPKGFYLRVVDGQHWLRGYRCDDEHRFSADDRFAFQLQDG